MKKESGNTLYLGYIDTMEALISPCFVNYSRDCELPGLKAEVWQTFAEYTGFKLEFVQSFDIGFGVNAGSTDPKNATYVLDQVASGAINGSLALSSMNPTRYQALKYTMPLYFSQNGLVAGKLLMGTPKPLALQVFNWPTIILFAILVLIIGIRRRQIWVTFAEYANKQQRQRSLTDAVLILLGSLLLINFNAGFRGQAAAIRRSGMINGSDLTKGLSAGTYRIITRELSAEYATTANLFGRPVTQADIDKLVTFETSLAEIARKLCEDERLICFEWFGGVNNLIGGRWRSADCILEKVETPDSADLTIRYPSGFALNRNFPRVYINLLNEIIMQRFTGNQLDRAMHRYDLVAWQRRRKANPRPDPMSLNIMSYGFIFFVIGCGLSIVAFIVEALIPTTTFDAKNVYAISVFPANVAREHSF